MPVPVTTFAPIATGGINQQPITSFVYEPIGVNIDITPRTHHDDEVSLTLKISLSSISGIGSSGLPTFGNREITTTIRLKDGETNMLAGLIRDEERTVLTGLPGLSDLPLIGRLFAQQLARKSHADRHRPDADAAHRPRARPDRSDLRPFRLGRDAAAPRPAQMPEQPATIRATAIPMGRPEHAPGANISAAPPARRPGDRSDERHAARDDRADPAAGDASARR